MGLHLSLGVGGEPIRLRSEPKGRQTRTGRAGGGKVRIHAQRGLGAGSSALQPRPRSKLENHQPSRATTLRSPGFSLAVGARPSLPPLPLGKHAGRTAPGGCDSPPTRLRVPLWAAPSRGRGLRLGEPPPPGIPAAAGHSERTEPETNLVPLSQTWKRRPRPRCARISSQPAPQPQLSCPGNGSRAPRLPAGARRPDGVLPARGSPYPGRALTTPRLRSSARGAGAAQPPRAASASSSSGSGGSRGREAGGPGPIALSGRSARPWRSPRPALLSRRTPLPRAPRPCAPAPLHPAPPRAAPGQTEPGARLPRRGGAMLMYANERGRALPARRLKGPAPRAPPSPTEPGAHLPVAGRGMLMYANKHRPH